MRQIEWTPLELQNKKAGFSLLETFSGLDPHCHKNSWFVAQVPLKYHFTDFNFPIEAQRKKDGSMIIKALLIVAALKLHNQLDEPVAPTLVYLIPMFIISLFAGASLLGLLLTSIVLGCCLFCYFLLLSRWNSGLNYYAIMATGIAVLVFLF